MAKTIIVTGASRGIGLSIATFLLKNSNNVIVVARSKPALEEIRSAYPERAKTLAGDLSDFTIAQKAVDIAINDFGRLDGVVVNHAIIEPVTKIADSDPAEWRRLYDVNFFSAVTFAKAALPSLRKSHGCIIFTSSGASVGHYSTWGAYGSSKAAMNHLAGQLACEEPDVTSLSIRPGVVDTEMQRTLRDVHSAVMEKKDNEKFLGLHRDKKLLRPEQPGHVMAKMVLDPPKKFNGKLLSWDAPELAEFQET